jgi:CobQ-like glutamine amidotransferase family enzyme
VTLRIVAVYPDLLGTYGDTGNAEILGRRASWRGIDVDVLHASSADPLPRGDLYCLGGGEDGPQVLAAQRLKDDGTLSSALEEGAVVFAVCAGFQIVGNSFPDGQGTLHKGLGLLDVATRKGTGSRCVGEVVVEFDALEHGGLGLPLLTGFENHAGLTALGPSARRLGQVRHGTGNGDGDSSEGAFQDRILGTYLHGPVLARNPALADLLLTWATGGDELQELDDSREIALREERLLSATRATNREGFARKP